MAAKRQVKKAKAPARGAGGTDKDRLLQLYRDMLLIRRFEERAGQLYGMGLIGGFCHLYIGQEAIVVGMQACLEPGDEVITSYRDHGHMLATGMEARGVMAELTGRSGGYSKGKGGSMHMFTARRASTAATESSAPGRARRGLAFATVPREPHRRWPIRRRRVHQARSTRASPPPLEVPGSSSSRTNKYAMAPAWSADRLARHVQEAPPGDPGGRWTAWT